MTKPSDLPSLIGQEVGVSRWITVDQARIDAFAKITEDEQFIHIDPERARARRGGISAFLVPTSATKWSKATTIRQGPGPGRRRGARALRR